MTALKKNDATIKTLALCHFAGVKPRMMQVLLTKYGSLDNIFTANAGSLMSIDGITTEQANKITIAVEYINRAEDYYRELSGSDIDVISRFDDFYCERLFELNDPPSLLYFRGSLMNPSDKLVALCGSEKAGNEGIELTSTIAKILTKKNIPIVSSLSSGIDSAAHLGARAADGKTYAVLEGGFDHISPEENRPLAIDIVKTGGLITEHPKDKKPTKTSYKQANRIIAGMSQAVIITEFYKDSKRTINLIECCLEVGKMLFVLIDPALGGLTDEKSFNKAISCGAIPLVGLEKIDDIIASLV